MSALTDKQALLIAEGCKKHKEMKAAEARLAAIKEELDLPKGKYVNNAGDSLTITSEDKYTEIDPEKLYMQFVKNNKIRQFWSVVKVQITPLGKIIPESSISKMRDKLDPTTKWFWNR